MAVGGGPVLKATLVLVDGLTSSMSGVVSTMQGVASKISSSFSNVGRAVFSLKSALIGLGGAAVVKSFIDTGSSVENMRIKLKVLLGDVGEANKLFNDLTTYAGNVPFTLEQVMNSATRLASVLKGGRDDIMKWMPMIGDLAAVYNLDITDATNQVAKMLSAGAAAADQFRDLGVLSFLGFRDGVKYSAEDSARVMMNAWNKAGSRFKGATDQLAGTWAGQVSMMQDAWFKFKKSIMDEGGSTDFLTITLQSVREETELLEVDSNSVTGSLVDGFTKVGYVLGVAGTAVQKIYQGMTALEYVGASAITTVAKGLQFWNDFIDLSVGDTNIGNALEGIVDDYEKIADAAYDAMIPMSQQEDFHVRIWNLLDANKKQWEDTRKEQGKSTGEIIQHTEKIEDLIDRMKGYNSEVEINADKWARLDVASKAFNKNLGDAAEWQIALRDGLASVGDILSDGIINITEDWVDNDLKKADEYIKDIARNLARVLAQQALKAGVEAAASAIAGAESGGVLSAPVSRMPIRAFASGGVPAGVTSGPELWMVGEGNQGRDREAIIPLENNRYVRAVINDQGGGGSTIINNYINAMDAQSFDAYLGNNRGAVRRAHATNLREQPRGIR